MSETQPPDARPDRATLLAFTGVVLFGGANAIAVKLTVAELAPFWGAAMRFLAAGALLLLVVVLTRRALPRGRSLGGAALYGLVGFAASYGFAYIGLREVPAGTAMILIALTPLLTFGLAIAHRQERFHLQGLLGALIAVVGVGVVGVGGCWRDASAQAPQPAWWPPTRSSSTSTCRAWTASPSGVRCAAIRRPPRR